MNMLVVGLETFLLLTLINGLHFVLSSADVLPEELLASLVQWASELERPLFTYLGSSVDIPCIPPDKTDPNRRLYKYMWLDNKGIEVNGGRFMKIPDGVLRVSGTELEDTGLYRCIPNAVIDQPWKTTSEATVYSTSSAKIPNNSVESDLIAVQPTVNPLLSGRAYYTHTLIVLRMPNVAIQYRYVYKVPVCDSDRMSQKMAWFSKRKVDVARQSNVLLQRFGLRLARPNCSRIDDAEPTKTWKSLRSYFVLNAQTSVEGSDVMFKNPTCNVDCLKLMAVAILVNVTQDIAEKWRDEEKYYKIHEDMLLDGEAIFPEFEFQAELFGQGVAVDCGYGHRILNDRICVPCLIGTFYDRATDLCQPCPQDSFQDQLAKLDCQKCPEQTFTVRTGARSIAECFRHPLLHSMPTHYVIFTLFVVLVFVVNLTYVVFHRRNKIASYVSWRLKHKRLRTDFDSSTESSDHDEQIVFGASDVLSQQQQQQQRQEAAYSAADHDSRKASDVIHEHHPIHPLAHSSPPVYYGTGSRTG